MRELSLSVSHSYDLVLYAFARGREIGIDVELVRQVPQGDEIAARFFTLREQAAYLSLEERDRPHAFLRWWTCKEAYLKATGAGLGGGLDAIDVALARDEPAKLVRVAGDGHEATRWSLTELAPADAYLGALVADGRELQPRCWHLPDARACLGIGP